MTAYSGTQCTAIDAGKYPDVSFVGGRVRAFVETFTYASQAAGSTIKVAELPVGAVILGFMLITDTSTGTATLAFGDGTTAAKYAAASAYTTTNVPSLIGNTAGPSAEASAAGEVILTTATASLPASGNLVVVTFYVVD